MENSKKKLEQLALFEGKPNTRKLTVKSVIEVRTQILKNSTAVANGPDFRIIYIRVAYLYVLTSRK